MMGGFCFLGFVGIVCYNALLAIVFWMVVTLFDCLMCISYCHAFMVVNFIIIDHD